MSRHLSKGTFEGFFMTKKLKVLKFTKNLGSTVNFHKFNFFDNFLKIKELKNEC